MSIQSTMRLISAVAAGVLATYRFVAFDASAEVDYPSAQGPVSGVTQEAADAQGKVIPIALQDGALVKVEAGAIVAKGADVATDATGRVITAAAGVGNQILGKAMEAAGAAGDIITIHFVAQGQATA